MASRLRRLALAWSLIALAVFGSLTLIGGVPESGVFGHWEAVVQVVTLALIGVGALLAMRSPGLGGTIMAFGSVVLGVLATVEFHPLEALLAALAFFVPATIHLTLWQRTLPLARIAFVGPMLLVLLFSGGFAAAQTHEWFYGPTHPQSPRQLPDEEIVEWGWTGAVTTGSATVKAQLAESTGRQTVSLVVAPEDDPSRSRRVPPASGPDDDDVVSFEVDGLTPGTTYEWAVAVGDTVDDSRTGTFRTFPEGPSDLTLAFSGCARLESNGQVYEAILAQDPDLFVVTGDFFYGDIDGDDPDKFRDRYAGQLEQPAPNNLFRSVPMGYVWDDHDFGPDNADRRSKSKPAASSVYRQLVPHYPLAIPGPRTPIAQAFSIGRVRVVMTDVRSQRAPAILPESPNKTMLGRQQKQWLLDEIATASESHALVVWVSSVPWIGPAGSSGWGEYARERVEIATAIGDAGVDNLVMVGGDAHMLAIDDGTNSAYGGGSGFPVLQAAALDRPGTTRGGPYSEGLYPGSGQFGVLEVNDDGGKVDVTLRGLDWRGETVVVETFEVPGSDADG